MVEAVEKAGVAEHGLVQLPARARRHPREAADRRGTNSVASTTTGRVSSSRIGRSRRTCRRAVPDSGASTVDAAGSGVTGDLLAHCIDTAMWLNGGIGSSVSAMTETFVKERHAQPDRQGRAGRHRRRVRVPRALRATARSPRSSRRATRAATRRSTPSRSTASTRRSRGTCTICTASATSTTATIRSVARLALRCT